MTGARFESGMAQPGPEIGPDEIRTIMGPHMIRISEQLPQRGPEREKGSEAWYLLKDSKRGPAFTAQIQG